MGIQMVRPTDTELLNWLQEQLNKKTISGKAKFVWLRTHGHGFSLHESRDPDAWSNVRDAIIEGMAKANNND